MGSSSVRPTLSDLKEVTGNGGFERLSGLKVEVAPDGSHAIFTVQHVNQRPFRLLVPFNEMPAIMQQVSLASALMVNRQAQSAEGSAAMFIELWRTAMRPKTVVGTLDRANGDQVYIMQFSDHCPLSVRLTAEQAFHLQADMIEKRRRIAH